MKMLLKLVGLGVGAVVLAAAFGAQAAVYLQYDGSAGATTGLTLHYPWDSASDGQSSPRSGIVFGLYNISGWDSSSGGTKTVPNWVSICLSPGGTISGRELVQEENFGLAAPGHLPNNWSPGGIYNAAYLYNTYVDSAAGDNAKAVGLALAILDALYDSTGKGTMSAGAGIGTGMGAFWVEGSLNGALAAYNDYIAAVNTANINENKYYVGSVYRPVTSTGAEARNGQDFIVKGVMVPEAPTIIAGALLLLPFGVSTLRTLRRSRTA